MTRVFGSGPKALLTALRQGVEPLNLAEGDVLYRQHEPGDAMFIVLSGDLETTVQEPDGRVLRVGQLRHGQSVGEASLLAGQERLETVTAITPSQLAKISKRRFDELAADHPEARAGIARIMLQHLRQAEAAEVVQNVFGQLDEATLQGVNAEIEWVQLASGETLMRQGDLDSALYMVVSGRLAVTVTSADGQDRLVDELARGESVGEMALLSNEPRTATVHAIRDSTLLKLSQAGFNRLMEQHPQSVLNVVRLIIRRFRTTLQSAPRIPRSTALALIPMSGRDGFVVFADKFTAALSGHDTTIRLDGEALRAHLRAEGYDEGSDPHLRDFELTRWLDGIEASHEIVVYQADAALTEWTRRCLRQADHFLLVTEADAPKAVGEVELELRKSHAGDAGGRKDLVLLYPDASRNPIGTRAWLDGRDVTTHHHVRLDSSRDFSHLARMLTGRAVGLALSGGGARGFAHIGTIRAMKELGIPIDVVGGTSMGAVISAEYAAGWDEGKMVEHNRKISSVLVDYTLPVVSLLTGQKFSRLLRRFFGEVEIEDLWVPFFCVSSNLTRAEKTVHQGGLLRRAVRASGTLAGLMPPVVFEGDLHVDGALFDNLPTDVMRDQVEGGFVVGVDVSPPVDLAKNSEYEDGLSGFAVIARHINPFAEKKQYATIASIIQRAFEVGSISQEQSLIRKNVADLYLRPPVESFGLFDQKAIDDIVEAGYRYAVERLKDVAKERAERLA